MAGYNYQTIKVLRCHKTRLRRRPAFNSAWQRHLYCLLFLLVVMIAFNGCTLLNRSEVIRVAGYGTKEGSGKPESLDPPLLPPALDWNETHMTAVGIAVPSAAIEDSLHRQLAARSSAKQDALRNLARNIAILRINKNTLVKDYLDESESFHKEVETYIKNATVSEEKLLDDGSWRVSVILDLAPFSKMITDEYERKVTARRASRKKIVLTEEESSIAYTTAVRDAFINLVDLVAQIQVQPGITIDDLMFSDDKIKSNVLGIIQQARVVSSRYDDEGTCETVIAFDINKIRQQIQYP